MINLPSSVINEYKDFNREIKAYGILYLATKTIVDGEYVINYTSFNLTEENHAKILSFNINEKADVYYTSLPYNTMTIEVDNEKGYFTDYDPDNILNQLNENCYVELYMSINNGTYYKIMTMNFDSVAYSDYTKAKLNFYSNLANLEKLTLRDINLEYSDWVLQFSQLSRWITDNYKINVISDHPDLENDTQSTISANFVSSSLKDYLLSVSTYELGQIFRQGVLLTNNYMNWLSFKAILNVVNDTITSDLQLQKPILKKEDTYKGVKYDRYDYEPYEETNETYSKTIRGTLQAYKERIMIVDYNCKLNNITTNEVTSSENVDVVVETNDHSNAMTLTITGTIGDEYTVSINKSNVYKRPRTQLITWTMGDTTDTSKILEVNDEAPVESSMYVFLFIKKPMKSYVEIQIMGLPHLEIGDTINVELENRSVKIFITEIQTRYDDGLIQTIKGYELDWKHQVSYTQYNGIYSDLNGWDSLNPANDLYPSDTLYPY